MSGGLFVRRRMKHNRFKDRTFWRCLASHRVVRDDHPSIHTNKMAKNMVQTEAPGKPNGAPLTKVRSAEAGPSAPYIAFASVLRVLEALRGDGSRHDDVRQFIEAMDKRYATHRLSALRFLGLLDTDSLPTPALGTLVGAVGTAAWPDALAGTIRMAYRPLFELDLAHTALTLFVATFGQCYTGSETVLRKSRTFFVHAAIQARIPLSPGIMDSAKPRAGDRVVEAARNRPVSAPAQRRDLSGSPGDGTNPAIPSEPLAVRLLTEVDTRAMDDEVRQAFWTLLRHLKEHGL